MTDDARTAILTRLQDAGGASHLAPIAHPGAYAPPGLPAALRVERFVAQLAASGARVQLTNAEPSLGTDIASFQGALGVAESGAIWVAPHTTDARQQLFLAEHVTLVVRVDAIVETLHEAYAQLDVAAAPFGCFVCGPSKTADIEQTLVVGAHGPLALTVWLLERASGDQVNGTAAGTRSPT
jgi:L-lactate dehydrogenase complex protein LldG